MSAIDRWLNTRMPRTSPTDLVDDLRYDLYTVDALVAEVLLPWREHGVRETMIAERYSEMSSLRRSDLSALLGPESDDARAALGVLLASLDALEDAVLEWEAEVADGA